MTHSTRSRFYATVRWILAGAAAGVAGAMAACQSPLSPELTEQGSQHYVEGLLARAIMDGSFSGQIVSLPTLAAGVHEQRWATPAASLGLPDTPVAAPAPPSPAPPEDATAPATQPLELNPATTQPTEEIGMRAGRLDAPQRVVDLTLQQALARAVRHALSIKVEAYNPAIKESVIVQQEGVFDPVLFGASQWSETDEPNNQQPVTATTLPFNKFIPPSLNNGQSVQNQVGIKQLLASGAQVQASAGANFRAIPSGVTLPPLFPSSWTDNLNLTLTQPLARGFGADVNEANIYIARVDRRIALETFKRQVITTVGNVEEAYHDLYFARRNVEILRNLVDQSKTAQKRVYARRPMDADETSIAQVDGAVLTHTSELARAVGAMWSASDKLKGLLNDPQLNPNENLLVNPTDEPTIEPLTFSTASLVTTALQQRTEIQEARLKIEQADITVRVAKNGLLPKVDLTLGVQTNGLDDSFDSAFGATVNPGHFIDFNAGIRIEIPIGNREAQGLLRQRHLEREQVLSQMIQAAQNVITDVKTNLRDVLTSYDQIKYYYGISSAYETELAGLTAKEEISRLTPEFLQLKLDSQTRVANAQQNLAQAMVNYNLAIMHLETSKGTLLEYNRISLDRPPTNPAQRDMAPMMPDAPNLTK